MESELDLQRLSELQELLGTDLAEIAATLVRELTTAVAQIDAGLAADDLPQVALAAHAARNSALMIDARPLLTQLADLESCARQDDLTTAREARDRLREVWPSLRHRLQQAAAPAE